MDNKIVNDSSISLKMTSENIGQIISIMNNLANKRGIKISLSFDEKEQESILTIYPNIMNRNDVSSIVATSSEQEMDFNNASDITKEMLRLHETLRLYGSEKNRMNSVIELQNGLMGRNFNLKHTSGSYDYVLDNELAQSPFTRKKDSQGFMVFSLGEKDFGENLGVLKRFNGNLMSHLIQNDCKMVESDEFLRIAGADPVRRQIRESIIGKNGDKILAEVFDDIGLAKNVADQTLDLMNRLRNSGVNIRETLKQYPMDSLLTTKVSKSQAMDIVKGFFKSLDIDVTELLETGKMSNGNEQEVYLSFNSEVARNEASSPTFQTDDVHAYVKETGTLTDVYALVHEISHTFYVQNGFNEARMILGEVVPQCMERLLDGYLGNLTESQNIDYGFDKKVLREDIRKRQISTTIDRLDISSRLANNKYQHAGKKAEFTRYMLAQLYSTQFMKFGEAERKGKILQFISAIKDNNIQQANEVFGIEIDRQSDRSQCISDSILDLQQALTTTSEVNDTIDNINKEKKMVVENDKKVEDNQVSESKIQNTQQEHTEPTELSKIKRVITSRIGTQRTEQSENDYRQMVIAEPSGVISELITNINQLSQQDRALALQIKNKSGQGENVDDLTDQKRELHKTYRGYVDILSDFILKHQSDSKYIENILEQMPFLDRANFINHSQSNMISKGEYGGRHVEISNVRDVYEQNIDREVRKRLSGKSFEEVADELYNAVDSVGHPKLMRRPLPKYNCINFALYRIDEELGKGIYEKELSKLNFGGKTERERIASAYGYGRNIYEQHLPPKASDLDLIGYSDYHRQYVDTLYWAQKITTEDRARLGLSEINAVTAEMRKDLTQTQQQEIETK